MGKVLLDKAIKLGTVYHINNSKDYTFRQEYYYRIDGLIRFISMTKKKITHSEERNDLEEVYFENSIIELELEYKNLSYYDRDSKIFENNSTYIIDSEGYHFEPFSLGKSDGIGYFIPKVWQKRKLLFLVPDEESTYSFEIEKTDFIEQERA